MSDHDARDGAARGTDPSGAPLLLRPALAVVDRLGTGARLALLVAVPAVRALLPVHAEFHRRAVTLAAILLGGALAVAIRWRSRQDVARAIARLAALTAADETPPSRATEFPDGRDDLGYLGRALERAAADLVVLEQSRVRGREESVAQQRAHLREQRNAEAQARQRAQDVVTGAAAAVVGELEEVVETVEAVSSSGQRIDRSVERVDEVARGLVDRAADADRRVGALGESLRQVASIAALINGVADQTKLLALNATIEAVRAGEAGRGFNVVANEVKQLAVATARSTDEIRATIDQLERDAAAVSSAIEGMARFVEDVNSANAMLSGVASEQGELVCGLTRRLDDAMARVRTISQVSSELERRDAPRVPLAEAYVLRSKGREHQVRLHDVSETGARCLVPDHVALAVGDAVELLGPLGGTRVTLAAEVVRLPVRGQVGLRFTRVDDHVRGRLRAFVGELLLD